MKKILFLILFVFSSFNLNADLRRKLNRRLPAGSDLIEDFLSNRRLSKPLINSGIKTLGGLLEYLEKNDLIEIKGIGPKTKKQIEDLIELILAENADLLAKIEVQSPYLLDQESRGLIDRIVSFVKEIFSKFINRNDVIGDTGELGAEADSSIAYGIFDAGEDLPNKPDISSDELIAKILLKDTFFDGLPDSKDSSSVDDISKKKPIKFVGFNASDNTCYANASLQLLINAPSFGRFLENEAGALDEESFILQELRKLFNAYTCDEPYCSNEARLNLIQIVMDNDVAPDPEFKSIGESIEFGRFSSPNLFFELLFQKLTPGSENTSLKDNLQLLGVNLLSDERYADAVILHVNNNHYVIKFKDKDTWTLIDEKQVFFNMTLEQIDRKYSRVVPVLSVKYI